MTKISQIASRLRDTSLVDTPGRAMSFEEAFYKTIDKMCPSDAEVERNRQQAARELELKTTLERKIANAVRLQYIAEYSESLKILPYIEELLTIKDTVKIYSDSEGVYLLELKFGNLDGFYNSVEKRRDCFIENFKQLNINFKYAFVTSITGREAYRSIYKPKMITNNKYCLMFHDTESSMPIIEIV